MSRNVYASLLRCHGEFDLFNILIQNVINSSEFDTIGQSDLAKLKEIPLRVPEISHSHEVTMTLIFIWVKFEEFPSPCS